MTRRYSLGTLHHWKTILGQAGEELFKRIISGWMKTKGYPYNWDTYFPKLEENDRKLWTLMLDRCNHNGWYWPRLKNGELVFGSRYPEHERPHEPGTWERIEKAAGFDDEDFIHED